MTDARRLQAVATVKIIFRSGGAGTKTPISSNAQNPGKRGGHDRRRGQRRPRSQSRPHRYRHGSTGHRRGPGSGGPGAFGRRFFLVGAGVRMGRRVFDNLKKGLAYILAVHIPIAGMTLAPVALNWPMILLPIHIAFPSPHHRSGGSVVFEAEDEEKNVMSRPPRNPEEPLFGRAFGPLALIQGGVVTAVVFALVCRGAPSGPTGGRRPRHHLYSAHRCQSGLDFRQSILGRTVASGNLIVWQRVAVVGHIGLRGFFGSCIAGPVSARVVPLFEVACEPTSRYA
jgi:hypothetical protein